MPRAAILIGTAAFSLGCAASGAAAASAVVNTAVAVGASGASRAAGGCYAACPVGTQCNTKTGYCDTIPCRGLCQANEHCDQSGPMERCAPGATDIDLKIDDKVTPQ
jgi:hypothetical protein